MPLVLFGNGEATAGLSSIASAVVNGLFAVGVAWYLLTRAIPRMQKEAASSNEKQQKAFAEALVKQQEAFSEALEKQQDKHDLLMKAELAALQGQVQQNGLGMDEVREALAEIGVRLRRRRPAQQPPIQPPGQGLTGGTKT